MAEKLTKEQAIEKLKEWADFLEVPTDTDDFKDMLESLALPVINGRLDYDIDSETFKYKLLKPIQLETTKIELVEMHELSVDEQRCIQKYKDNEKVDTAVALLAKVLSVSLAEASKISARDFGAINAVNSVFFS